MKVPQTLPLIWYGLEYAIYPISILCNLGDNSATVDNKFHLLNLVCSLGKIEKTYDSILLLAMEFTSNLGLIKWHICILVLIALFILFYISIGFKILDNSVL